MHGPGAHIDFETRSTTDLRKSGVYRYCEDPHTRPWGFSWRIGDTGPMNQWRPGWPDPLPLLDHIRSGGRVVAHNAAFERTVWNWVVVPRMCPHWPVLRVEQQDCTMARASVVAMPQGLDVLGDALNQDMRKDKAGHALMMKMAKPRRFEADGTVVWWDDPNDIDTLMAYADQDVETETEADRRLPGLTPQWRQVWIFDQIINERGVRFDLNAVEKCEALVTYSKKQNDRLMREITNREVPKCSSDKKLIEWLNKRGVECDSLAKGVVEDVVFMASCRGDDAAERAIRLRQAAWKTSTAKYKAVGQCVSSDGRVRGLLNFHKASTGRWAGRLVQPQNFKRNTADSAENFDDEYLHQKVKLLHELVGGRLKTAEIYDILALVYGPDNVLDLLSKALRSMIVADEGKKFVSGDFSNIEGRINAWQAGERWKLEAFAAYDRKEGPDLYTLAYAKSFGVPVESVGKGQKRQIGKVQELSLGYQGGVNAYISMGANYAMNPYTLIEPVRSVAPSAQWDKTAFRYHLPNTNRYGLGEDVWTALRILVDNHRDANPATTQSWWNLQDAAIDAVCNPGNVVYPEHTRVVSYYYDGSSLWGILPSQRMLHYANAYVVSQKHEYYDKLTGERRETTRRSVRFEGVDSVTGRWTTQYMYGGLQCENFVQAIAVDILVDAMFRVEHAGYPVVLTVHDEILTEVDERSNWKNPDDFASIMAETSSTYDGLPVAVSAWEDKRYVK